LFNFILETPTSIAMLDFMLKKSFQLCSGAEATSLGMLPAATSMKSFDVVVRLTVVVLISILISPIHAAPV
jgi:hypothetical protein